MLHLLCVLTLSTGLPDAAAMPVTALFPPLEIVSCDLV